MTLSPFAITGLSLVGTMYYDFDSNGKQFRKRYVDANGSEQKYLFEFRDDQNVAVQLPTNVVSHAKSDHFGRKVFDELQLGGGMMNRKFSYYDGQISDAHIENDKRVSEPYTTLVKKIDFADGRTIQYEYDNEERITKVIDSVDGTYEYTYDALGQLETETKYGVTTKFEYDNYGNITAKGVVDETGEIAPATKISYVYGNDTWRDLLTSYNGQSITYDAQGNPTSYLGHTLTWEKGRQLKTLGTNTYWYNKDGIRTKKAYDGKTHTYTLDGTNIIKEKVTGSNPYTAEYFYDLDGTACGLKYGGNAYYFYKNLQGDVIAITDNAGTVIARYTYDAWGKVLSVTDANGNAITSATHIANINPFRYRSYYYDAESRLYYLQSRYYDPEVGRFINADEVEFVSLEKHLPRLNIFAYCCNNTINFIDSDGYLAWTVKRTTLAFAIDITLTLVSAWAKYAYDLIGKVLEITVKPFLNKRGRKYIFDILLGTVPKVVSWASKFLTVVRTVLWRLGYIGLSAIISSLTDWIVGKLNSWVNTLVDSDYKDTVDIISCFFSTGGMVALMLDLFTDGYVDNKVKLI